MGNQNLQAKEAAAETEEGQVAEAAYNAIQEDFTNLLSKAQDLNYMSKDFMEQGNIEYAKDTQNLLAKILQEAYDTSKQVTLAIEAEAKIITDCMNTIRGVTAIGVNVVEDDCDTDTE